MSLSPFLRAFWDDPWEGLTRPSRLSDQNFGNMITDESFHPLVPAVHAVSLFPRLLPQQQIEVVNTDKEFRVCLDVQHFKPEEINIKTKDNRVIINARHEERPDEHGFIMREFTRQYVLPKDVDPATLTSSLSREGKLMLKAPKKALEGPKETSIPITMEQMDEK